MRTRPAIMAALIAGVLLFGLPVVASASSAAASSAATGPVVRSAAVQLNDAEQMALRLINRQRTKHGLHALRLNALLTAAARAHSSEMGDRQYFSHSSSDGQSFASRIASFGYSRKGYRAWRVGENIYWGAGLFGTAVAAVDDWMHSAAHRRVILTRGLRDIGLGAVDCSKGFDAANSTVTFFTMDVGRRSK